MKNKTTKHFYVALSFSLVAFLALGSTSLAWFLASRLNRGNIAEITTMDMINVDDNNTYILTDDYPTLASLQENNITSVDMSAYDPFIMDNNLINNAVLVINCSIEYVGQLQLDISSNSSGSNVNALSHVIQVESLYYDTYTGSLDFTTLSALFETETPTPLYDYRNGIQNDYSDAFTTNGPVDEAYLFINFSYYQTNIQYYLSAAAGGSSDLDITNVPTLQFRSDIEVMLIPRIGVTA